MMNNTTIVDITSVITTLVSNVSNHTSDAFQLIPMTLFTYISLAVFKLYNSYIN